MNNQIKSKQIGKSARTPKMSIAAMANNLRSISLRKQNPPRARAPRMLREEKGLGPLVSVSSSYSQGQTAMKPRVFQDSVDSSRIVHRELIASVTGSAAFAVPISISLNPGLATSFPWLSTQALGWEQYQFRRVRLCAYTRTSTAVPGSLMLLPDYDAADAAPVSEQVASAYYGAVEDAPWKTICLELDPKRLKFDRFVRTGGLAANLDVKLYDIAKLFVCTVDGTAVPWSKLWIEYDVVFKNPQLPSAGAPAVGTLVSAGGSVAAATPFGAVPTNAGSFALVGAATNVLSFTGLPIGAELAVSAYSVGTGITAYSLGTPVGLTLVGSSGANNIATGALTADFSGTWTVTAANATLTLAVTATTVTGTAVVASILPAGSGF